MKPVASPWWLLGAFLIACSASDPSADPGDGTTGNGETPKTDDEVKSGGPGGGTSGPAASTGLPCDVQAVLEKNCQTCHGATPAYGAPSSFVNYSDVKKSVDRIKVRIHDDKRPMPPQPNPRLDAKDLATMDSWIEKGAPSSTETCGAAKGGDDAPVTKPLGCAADQFVRPAAKYTMPANKTDEYVCYGFDVNPGSKRHVIGLAPKVDNKAIVHHIILFQSPTSVSSTPTPCSQGGGIQWRMVAGWAPGGGNVELPPEAGFPESGTTHWVAQVHYNNAKGVAGLQDGSGYDLCTTDQLRANDADIMAFGSMNFNIAPRSTLDLTCDFKIPSGLGIPDLHVFAGSPHMHTLGKSLTTERIRGGVTETLVSQPNFDFQTQLGYPANMTIKGGDTMRTHCAWQNPGDSSVKFGENTSDEMCFMFVSYYPKIDSPLFSWAMPSALASCR